MRLRLHAFLAYAIGLRGAIAAALLVMLPAASGTAQEAYRLNPGDQISIRIVSWDTIALQFTAFEALNGVYVVGTDGTVIVPLLGPLNAAGMSALELADAIATQMQKRLGLAQPPGASIEIVGFRPIYVLGAVGQPGPYDFSPGLTVQQALALAGGLAQVAPEGPTSTIRAAGALSEIGISMARQQIRAARLRAEMRGDEEFVAPEISGHPGGTEAVAAIVDQERSLFIGRKDAQKRALEALADGQALLETEIAALQGKLGGQSRQVDLLREQVGNMESLVEQGLARSPTFVALQGALSELESRQLDTETAVFRARQSIAELQRDRVDKEAARQLEVLSELQKAEAEIERLAVERDMTRDLIAETMTEGMVAATEAMPEPQVIYRITRRGEQGSTLTEVPAETRLEPADVLEVAVIPAEEGD